MLKKAQLLFWPDIRHSISGIRGRISAASLLMSTTYWQGPDDPPLGEEQPGVREQGLHAALLLGPAQKTVHHQGGGH